MAEKWHFFPFSHPWASLCQTLPDASSVSVSSPEPRVSPASPQVHPTWVVWEALLGVHVDDVAGNPVLDHRPCHSLRTAGRESFFTLFHSSSCVCVPDPISPVTSFVTLLQHMQLWGYASRNHHKLCPKFPSLVFFFFFNKTMGSVGLLYASRTSSDWGHILTVLHDEAIQSALHHARSVLKAWM